MVFIDVCRRRSIGLSDTGILCEDSVHFNKAAAAIMGRPSDCDRSHDPAQLVEEIPDGRSFSMRGGAFLAPSMADLHCPCSS
jgi:hypothetical protein